MNSKDIKVRGFRGLAPEVVANAINEWLANNDVEVVDIKVSSAEHNNTAFFDALVIYK